MNPLRFPTMLRKMWSGGEVQAWLDANLPPPPNDLVLEALKFYADGNHFIQHDPTAWDTVSGEPANFHEDEANTATVEDGSVAKLALAGMPLEPIEALPGYLFIAKDDDGFGHPLFCADRAAVIAAAASNMFSPSDNLDADEREQCEGVADGLIEDGCYDFEGDPGFTLYRLRDGSDIVAQAMRQAFFLHQERERALGSLQAECAGLAAAGGHLGALVDELHGLLEESHNGLKWYRDAHPADDSGADDELYQRIDAALAKLAPATPATKNPLEALPDGHLYRAVNNLLCHIGMEGSIDSRHGFVSAAMDALHAIDGGVYLEQLAKTFPAAPSAGVLPALPPHQGQIFDDGYWLINKNGPRQGVMGGREVWLEEQVVAYARDALAQSGAANWIEQALQFVCCPSWSSSHYVAGKGILATLKGSPDACDVPPAGWRCTRAKGHEGPCAAIPATDGNTR